MILHAASTVPSFRGAGFFLALAAFGLSALIWRLRLRREFGPKVNHPIKPRYVRKPRPATVLRGKR